MLGAANARANGLSGLYGAATAGESAAQQSAFTGIANLTVPTDRWERLLPAALPIQVAQTYMNPYLQTALQPQIDEARRQAEIQRVQNAGRLTRAGHLVALAGDYGF